MENRTIESIILGFGLFMILLVLFLVILGFQPAIKKENYVTMPKIEWEGGFKGVSYKIDRENNTTLKIFCQ